MKKITFLLFILCLCKVNANTIRLDSIFSFLNNEKKLNERINNIVLTDSITVDNVYFCKLFKVNNDLKKSNDYSFELFYNKKEIKKVKIINNKRNLQKYFYVIDFESLKILLPTHKNFFIIPQNDFFLFFCFLDSNNPFSIENIDQIVSVDSKFNPITKMYANNSIILAYSNFEFKNESVYEQITIYRQNIGRCVKLNNIKFDFINSFFQQKGIYSCDGLFKIYNIQLDKKFINRGDFFWFIGYYQQRE